MTILVNRAAPTYHVRNSIRNGVDVSTVGAGHGAFVDVNLCVYGWLEGDEQIRREFTQTSRST